MNPRTRAFADVWTRARPYLVRALPDRTDAHIYGGGVLVAAGMWAWAPLGMRPGLIVFGGVLLVMGLFAWRKDNA